MCQRDRIHHDTLNLDSLVNVQRRILVTCALCQCIPILFLSTRRTDNFFFHYYLLVLSHLLERTLNCVAGRSCSAIDSCSCCLEQKRFEVAAVVWSLSRCRAVSMARSLASLLASARFGFVHYFCQPLVVQQTCWTNFLFHPNKINLLNEMRGEKYNRPSTPHDACSIAFYHRRQWSFRS